MSDALQGGNGKTRLRNCGGIDRSFRTYSSPSRESEASQDHRDPKASVQNHSLDCRYQVRLLLPELFVQALQFRHRILVFFPVGGDSFGESCVFLLDCLALILHDAVQEVRQIASSELIRGKGGGDPDLKCEELLSHLGLLLFRALPRIFELASGLELLELER